MFYEAHFYDSSRIHADGAHYAWWPRHELALRETAFSTALIRNPRRNLHIRQGFLQGVAVTLQHLWSLRADPVKQRALLLAAVLHTALNTHKHRRAPAGWPSASKVSALLGDLVAKAGLPWSRVSPWRWTHTTVIPVVPGQASALLDWDRADETDSDPWDEIGFLCALDAEAAAILAYWQPVVIRFNQAPAGLIASMDAWGAAQADALAELAALNQLLRNRLNAVNTQVHLLNARATLAANRAILAEQQVAEYKDADLHAQRMAREQVVPLPQRDSRLVGH